MALMKKISDVFKNAVTSGCSQEKLTQSVCIGMYIAFSPFPGLHTIIMFVIKYLMKLNLPVLFITVSINNPWTVIPFYTLDYAFGYWVVHNLFGWNPSMVISLGKLFGSGSICLWSFFIGGNVLGILAALISYPLANHLFKNLASRLTAAKEPETPELVVKNELP